MKVISKIASCKAFFIFLLITLTSCFLTGCNQDAEPSLKSENGYFQMVVTESAGSFVMSAEDDKVDSINNYFPLPLSYGHFDVYPLDSINTRSQINAFLMGRNIEVGEVVEIVPVAVYKMLDREQIIPLILAVPLQRKDRLIDVTSYFELQRECFTCKTLLEEWLLHMPAYKGRIFVGWENEKQAEKLLEEYDGYD